MKNSTVTSLCRRLGLTAVAVAALGLATPGASASLFLFQWDDGEPDLWGNTYKDGVLIQSVNVGNESYSNGYGLWDGAVLLDDIRVAANIYEGPGGPLSDTWLIEGQRGQQFIHIPFYSDVEGQPLQPLDNPTLLIIENGDWQTVAEFDVSTGDHYIWQFRSDAEHVPDTGSSLSLMGIALAGLVAGVRKCKANVA